MLITRLRLKKLLSFNDSTIKLSQLNVLIGPNAVGKSNLIEAIGLLQATTQSFTGAILLGGGVHQWIWLGGKTTPDRSLIAGITADLGLTRGRQQGSVTYDLQFTEANGGLVIFEESVKQTKPDPGSDGFYLTRSYNTAKYGALALKLMNRPQMINPRVAEMNLQPGEAVPAQFRNPNDPTPITEMGSHLGRIRIFREFRTGPLSAARQGTSTGIQNDSLADGGDNLALVLQDLDFRGVHDRVQGYLARLCDRFADVKVSIGENMARIFLRENGVSELLSAARISDGTLKFLCLLAALFHPSSPPLMCIEEPELGLHPDAMQIVADALVEASESTQLIVTTHSEALVDALTGRPESVLVCERDFDNGTQMKRLPKKALNEWLEDYSLGQLWRKGQIGGVRW